jgi:predicted Rossmann fold nucleotide-binding protein DprA/Smf involved in DNA uptake
LKQKSLVWEALDDEFFSSEVNRMTIIHGGARGADTLAHWWCLHMGRKVYERVYQADWRRFGRAAGPRRNQQMVDAMAGHGKVLAFYNEGSPNVGTRDCVSRARQAGLVVVEFTSAQ